MAVKTAVLSVAVLCWIFFGFPTAHGAGNSGTSSSGSVVSGNESTEHEASEIREREPDVYGKSRPLGPGDVVQLTVQDHAELSGDFTLDKDGRILYPLLGEVPLAGLYPKEGESLVRGRLEQDFLQRANVRLEAREYRSRIVTLVGGVGRPGTYPIGDGLRLLELLTRADPGDSREVRITRSSGFHRARGKGPGPNTERRTIRIRIDDLFSGHEPSNLHLREGDLVYLPRNGAQAHIIGEVQHPGPFPYESGMTVLKLLALAGGETSRAALKKIVALREQDGEIVEVPLGLADTIKPEDTVRVPKSFW